MSGLFVSFEGIEGCGKSTQVDRLLGELTGRRVPCVAMREPGGTPLGQQVRAILLDLANADMTPQAELLLYGASRAQLVRAAIRPAFSRGHVVLCDRYADSTLAYQCFGRGLARATVDAVNDVATDGLWPDVTILLDVPVEVGIGRVRGEPDRIEREGLDFHQRVRDGFLALAAASPARFFVLDGTEPVDALAVRVAKRVLDSLKP